MTNFLKDNIILYFTDPWWYV